MHPVADLIHRRLRGEKDDAKLAIVAESSGQKWVVLAGMASRLEAHGISAEIMGGTSGGALVMLYFSQQQTRYGSLNFEHLNKRGIAGNPNRQFLSLKNLFQRRPIMDIDTLIDEVFTKLYQLNWAGFSYLNKPFFVSSTSATGKSLIRRLDGQPIDVCKDYAKTTARLPLIGGRLNRFNEWDGDYTMPIPVKPALELGATHVLALRCPTPHHFSIENLFLLPALLVFNRSLFRLLLSRQKRIVTIEETMERLTHCLSVKIPSLKLSSACTDELQLAHHLLQGWDAAGATLQLPHLPYPALWRPTMERLGLAKGAEFA